MESVSYGAGFLLLLVLGRLTSATDSVCPLSSVKDSIFPVDNDVCAALGRTTFYHTTGVIEGDEITLSKALHIIHNTRHDYIALLFYSTWCPFSALFRPSFSLMSSLFPSILHIEIEESAVRPSILSKYGVHGFPTLILLNSTMRLRFQGPRTVESLTVFYEESTGLKKMPFVERALDKLSCSRRNKNNTSIPETCPFPWARSPESLFQQETYLCLATIFVLLRLFYMIFPTLRRFAQLAWRRYVVNMRSSSLWEHPVVYLNHIIQLFKSLKNPCKKSNLQEGAKNAQAWASKSLATVSFGDPGSPSCREQ